MANAEHLDLIRRHVDTWNRLRAADPGMVPDLSQSDLSRADLALENLSGALLYQLMAAEVAAQRGELGTAYAVYLKLARDTRDPRLAKRATELALQGLELGLRLNSHPRLLP